MTESEALGMLKAKLMCMSLEDLACIGKGCDKDCDNCNYCYEQGNRGQSKEALAIAIKALSEIQQYRAIGTVSEFRELKEKATAIRANAIDEFLERLCTVCCGESMGVIFGNRVKADMLTVDGVCEIAYEIAEAMKGE